MDRKWKTRFYRKGDEEGITKLYKIVFGKDFSLERWNWIYNKGADFPKFIALAEAHDGQIVGHYALMPIKVKCGNKDCMIATLSQDTMVHPDYRRQGMFPILANYIYDHISQQHVPFTYGFPNKNSYRGFIKNLNWVPFNEKMPLAAMVLNTKAVLSKVVPGGFISNLMIKITDTTLPLYYKWKKCVLPGDNIVEEVSRFGNWADTLWTKVSSNLQVSVIRNAEYLNWRYVDNPSENYFIYSVKNNKNIIAYMVIKIEERFDLKIGYIVDILVSPEKIKILDGLISFAVNIFSKNNVDIVNTLMYNNHYLKAFKKNGFLIIPRSVYPQDIYLGVLCHMVEQKTILNNDNNWFISWGDSDIV